MQATTTRTARRERNEQARARAIVRFNGLLFHSLAAASFLETAVPLHVNRLKQVFAARPDVMLWLEQIWWPQRAEHGRRLRDYLEATWPEFHWSAAYQEFHDSYRPRSALEGRGAGAALEALGLCVTAAQAAVFYRALAKCADEPALRTLARQAACDHGGCFDYFSALFERCKRDERVGLVTSWRTVRAACRSARDFDASAAFEPLGRHWGGAPTVPELGYGEFQARMVQLIQRHAALGRVERLLFRPWLECERSAPAPQLPEKRPERRLLLAPQLVAA
ncbi:MAG TPA: hypothetical protein VI545_00220 [Burkholderiales bacterium]|nr:hypothetical protein [Burkholderiales bacterium]